MGRGADASVQRAAKKALKISREEVAKHSTFDDAWVIVNNKVIDVSGWDAHPGGRVVFSVAGQDATDVFRGFHSAAAWHHLETRQVGEVEAVETSEFDKEVLQLRRQFRKNGWFKASPVYYLYKLCEVFGIAACSVAVLHAFPYNWSAVVVATLLMAVSWQQAGWLAHDFLHHQVFETRLYNDLVGLLVGNYLLAFSVDWWKNKHNTHHAIPNTHESEDEAHNGDPDIDTLPFLAWSASMAEKARRDESGWPAFFVRNQRLLFFPLLAFARLIWAQQSVAFALAPLLPASLSGGAWGGGRVSRSLRYPLLEVLGLFGHYATLATLMVLYMNPYQAAVFFFGAQIVSGLLLAISFVVGHNGMECFELADKPGYFELQLRTTRNVDDDFLGFAGWFTGGLHLQVEHHLFPTMPRHHLAKVRPYIEALCSKHGVRYHSASLGAGIVEVLDCLDEIAQPLVRAVQDFPAM